MCEITHRANVLPKSVIFNAGISKVYTMCGELSDKIASMHQNPSCKKCQNAIKRRGKGGIF